MGATLLSYKPETRRLWNCAQSLREALEEAPDGDLWEWIATGERMALDELARLSGDVLAGDAG